MVFDFPWQEFDWTMFSPCNRISIIIWSTNTILRDLLNDDSMSSVCCFNTRWCLFSHVKVVPTQMCDHVSITQNCGWSDTVRIWPLQRSILIKLGMLGCRECLIETRDLWLSLYRQGTSGYPYGDKKPEQITNNSKTLFGPSLCTRN